MLTPTHTILWIAPEAREQQHRIDMFRQLLELLKVTNITMLSQPMLTVFTAFQAGHNVCVLIAPTVFAAVNSCMLLDGTLYLAPEQYSTKEQYVNNVLYIQQHLSETKKDACVYLDTSHWDGPPTQPKLEVYFPDFYRPLNESI